MERFRQQHIRISDVAQNRAFREYMNLVISQKFSLWESIFVRIT